MRCPVCNNEVKYNSNNVCLHTLDRKYYVMYSLALSADGETVVVPCGLINPIMRMAGFHALTIERIEKLLLLQ